MSAATLIPLVIQLSLALMVLSVGLATRVEDLTYLFRKPKLLLQSLLSMYVVMPVFAALLAKGFDLTPVVRGSLILLAISPLPPIFPNKALKSGGERSYTIGLLVAATLTSIVFIPVALRLLERVFGIPMQMRPVAILALVFWTLLLPLALGAGVHRLSPAFAERAGKPVARVGGVLLILAVLPVLIKVWPAMMSLIGNGTILVMVVFALVGLAAGHLLGGPATTQRTVLALSTATRHPGIAIAIAAVNFPDEKLAPAAMLLYLLVSALAAKPYLAWLKRHSMAPVPAPART
jgi:bile acid:Na+ symporter, BASS family